MTDNGSGSNIGQLPDTPLLDSGRISHMWRNHYWGFWVCIGGCVGGDGGPSCGCVLQSETELNISVREDTLETKLQSIYINALKSCMMVQAHTYSHSTHTRAHANTHAHVHAHTHTSTAAHLTLAIRSKTATYPQSQTFLAGGGHAQGKC